MTTRTRRLAILGAAALVLSACATAPSGPSVMALPGSSKNFQAFMNDDALCRSWAERQTGVAPEQAAGQDAAAGAVIGTAIGAASGALIGAAVGNPGAGAAIGAGSGLLLGSGQGYATGANGNQVPVAAGSFPQTRAPSYGENSGRRLPPPPPPGLPPPPPPGAG